MEKPKVVYHILIDSRYEAGLIEQTLKTPEYDVVFSTDTEGALHITGEGSEVIILAPSLQQWKWLALLVRIRSERPDIPIVLYSSEIGRNREADALAEGVHISLANDVTDLKNRMAEILKPKPEREKTVLFVDDEPNMLKSYARALRKSRWKILTAENADSAMKTLETETVDLLITDIKMPNVHGIELISRIRENHGTLPVIICSAFSGMKDDDGLKFHRIADFIEKPVDSEVLKEKIERILG